MLLHNRVNREELKRKIRESAEPRVTISFYKYHPIGNPQLFRDHIYFHWEKLGVLGRIYVAQEGINAQISVPAEKLDRFRSALEDIVFLQGIRLNIAVEDDGKSFFLLRIKVRPKIVADGINDPQFNPSNTGNYLKAKEWNEKISSPETIVIDMRNHYESEVGHFENAWCPDVDTFRDSLPKILKELEAEKDKTILMYCTGGIRCEKASAYMKHHNFNNVYHLEGGIINYARQVKEEGIENKFKGKNFVFDERLGERVSQEIISKCHQCETLCDTHVNCKNKACNLLFLQCNDCGESFNGCCSKECMEFIALPVEEQINFRKKKDMGIRIFTKGRFRGSRAQ